MRVGVAT